MPDRNLFDYVRQRGRDQKPDRSAIVLRRRGHSDTIGGPVPGGHGEIMNTYDGYWMAKLEYEDDSGYFGAHKKTVTFAEACEALRELVERCTDADPNFEIAPQVEAYCWPKTRETDWYRAPVLYDDGQIISITGNPIARFEDGEMIVVDEQWRKAVDRVSRSTTVSHIREKQGNRVSEIYATWLLGCYMLGVDTEVDWDWVAYIDNGRIK